MFAFVVVDLVFWSRDCLGTVSLKWPILCQVSICRWRLAINSAPAAVWKFS